MRCPNCKCHIDPKTDWRLTIILMLMVFIIGMGVGWSGHYLQVRPLFVNQIQKDGAIKEELKKGYMPSRPEPKKKGEVMPNG